MKTRYSILALAIYAALNTVAQAETFTYTQDGIVTDDIEASQTMLAGGGGSLNGILAYAEAKNVQLLGEKISSTMVVDRSWSQANTWYSFSGIAAGSMSGEDGSTLQLGGDKTREIRIDVNVRGTGLDGDGDTHGLDAIGLWAFNNYQKVQTNDGGHITVTADDLFITVHSEQGSAYGVLAQNSTTQTTADPATVIINADNTYITATSGEDGSASALVAMSQGKLTVAGNLYAKADNVLVARGDAVVRINETNDKIVQLTGDINFNYDKETSGTSVDADVLVNLSGAESYWVGNAVTSYGSGVAEPDKMEVTGLKLGIADGAQWTPTFVTESSGDTTGEGQIGINNLAFNDGVINLEEGGAQQIRVANLQGTGGTVNAATSVGADGTLSTAKIDIAAIEGTPAMTVNYTGITSDQLTSENVDDLNALTVTEGSTLTKTENVEEGNIRGAWTRTTSADGETTEGYSENTKLSSYSSINALSLVQWRNEINHLTKRLGDIRASDSTVGAWARVYGGASEWGSNPEVDMDHTTIQVGGDYRINPNWIVGGAFSYTDSDAESSNGFADGESYSLAAYATYLADNGSFLDVIARYGYLKNDITAGNMALETKNNAFSLSVEGGHQFRFIEDRAYIEPQIELTYGFVSGDDADASNGVRIEQDDYQNLITRVGVRTGFDFPEKAGTIYATLSYSYDFLGDADGTASGQTEAGYESVALTEDLGGGWVTYGIGAQFRLGDNAFAYGELERTSGGDIDNPYLFNVGFRYNF